MLDLGLKPNLMAGNVIGIIAQRLVRKLCPDCKEMRVATAEECKMLAVDPANPPTRSSHTERPNWGTYPILFDH